MTAAVRTGLLGADGEEDCRPIKAITIVCASEVTMLTGGRHEAYGVGKKPTAYEFTLVTAERMPALWQRLQSLREIMGPGSAGSQSWARPPQLQGLIDVHEEAMAFDMGHLVDPVSTVWGASCRRQRALPRATRAHADNDASLNLQVIESVLLETKAEQITPLVANPGRLVLTDKRLYFQPFNSVQAAGVEKWNLAGGASGLRALQRRRHQLRPVGVEMLFGGGGAAAASSTEASTLSTALFVALPSNALRERLVELLCEHSAAVDDAAELPAVRAATSARHPACLGACLCGWPLAVDGRLCSAAGPGDGAADGALAQA